MSLGVGFEVSEGPARPSVAVSVFCLRIRIQLSSFLQYHAYLYTATLPTMMRSSKSHFELHLTLAVKVHLTASPS